MKINPIFYLTLLFILIFSSCNSEQQILSLDEEENIDCTLEMIVVDSSKGVCSETLTTQNDVAIFVSGNKRIISSNNIPNHNVGKFGNIAGALNPNAILPQDNTYEIDLNPVKATSVTQLQSNGPKYSFGILLNGVELDPVAAEPWPHTNPTGSGYNWGWNLEATMAGLGLDCNNAHVQPTGKYHYHGTPIEYLKNTFNIIIGESTQMSIIGWAADGFPVYYHYGHIDAYDGSSSLSLLNSSYKLKAGERPGDGVSSPCGSYTGVYTADYEYIDGLGDLDECNGREGYTPEFPNGTYYYIITDEYPGIPRCLVGQPSTDFSIGPN